MYQKAFLILDVHGSVIGLADDSESAGSTGVVVNYEYDAWGSLLNTPQKVLTGNGESLADANPFRYCGYQFDKETGFYYLKYRYYIPSLGRFLTRDPMLIGNRYVYCLNNPVNFVDPLGLLRIVDDYIVELPNKKIIDTRTGKVVSNNYWTNLWNDVTEEAKSNLADTAFEKAIKSATMSAERFAKYSFKKVSVGTNVTFIVPGKISAVPGSLRGLGKAGVVASYFLARDVIENYSDYNAGEATGRTAIDIVAFGGAIRATAILAPLVVTGIGIAATGLAAGAITFVIGTVVGTGLDYLSEDVKNRIY